MSKTKELREKVYKIILNERQSFPKANGDRQKAHNRTTRILKILKGMDMAFEDREAVPPENPYDCDTPNHTLSHFACNEGFGLMLKETWHKVEEIGE